MLDKVLIRARTHEEKELLKKGGRGGRLKRVEGLSLPKRHPVEKTGSLVGGREEHYEKSYSENKGRKRT